MAVSLSLIGETPFVKVYNGDAVDTLALLQEEPTLIFMDPPFNQNEPYESSDDAKDHDVFSEELHRWIEYAANAHPSSYWLNLPDEWTANAVVYARDVMEMTLENWCIWHYRFAQCQPNRFLRSKHHALWFSYGNPKVNREAALVPSDRAVIYDDIRTADSSDAGMRMDLDVWGFDRFWGRVQGNNKERRSTHPNQLPERYLERVISTCTDEGDLVVDPFCGSGTTATVCQHLRRRCITGDISSVYCLSALERIKKGVARGLYANQS